MNEDGIALKKEDGIHDENSQSDNNAGHMFQAFATTW